MPKTRTNADRASRKAPDARVTAPAPLSALLPGLAAALALAQPAAAQLEADRSARADALVVVFDDPVTDGRSASSTDAGPFLADLRATAVVAFSSARGRAGQDTRVDAGGRFEGDGFATAQLSVQGLADAAATSEMTLRFDVAGGGLFVLDELELLVDDAFEGQQTRDRPAEASVLAELRPRDGGDPLFAVAAELDDAGTRGGFLLPERLELPLDAGGYEFTVRAAASDTTDGFEEVLDSLAAATFFVAGEVVGPVAPCRPDLDADGELTIFDFLTFQNLFDAGDPAADFDGDGELTLFDFLAFQNAFDAGC